MADSAIEPGSPADKDAPELELEVEPEPEPEDMDEASPNATARRTAEQARQLQEELVRHALTRSGTRSPVPSLTPLALAGQNPGIRGHHRGGGGL